MKEITLRGEYIGGEIVETVYFGGGTPSLLETAQLRRILDALRSAFTLAPDAEITLEANPDDIAPFVLREWQAAGINRLSIGVQSFFEEDLRWMNRAHSAGQARAAIREARDQGYDNISIDLIYGGPTLDDARWKRNVDEALGLDVPHLSCYALTVEPRTALDHHVRMKKKPAVDPDTQARQFLLLIDWLEGAGYEHYEISNFSKPGHRSRHNSSYWQGKTYLGLGPSAHSFNGVSRQWNIADHERYAAGLTQDKPLFEREQLSGTQQLNEFIMISLRTAEGCDLGQVTAKFGKLAGQELTRKAERFLNLGMMAMKPGMMEEHGRLVLTREGKLLADGIAADLFFLPA